MEFFFHRVYEVADLMANLVDVDSSFDEFDWDSPGVSACLTSFSKTSLLAHFCFNNLAAYDSRKWRKDPETVDIESVEYGFQRYAIPLLPFRDFVNREFPQANPD